MKSGNNVALCKANGDTECEPEGELDLFQLEVVSDKEVYYACNLCNEGFNSEDEVKDHLKKKSPESA